MDTYKAICTICESPVYYYPAKLLLESTKMPSTNQTGTDTRQRIVSCNCSGEKGGIKHTLDYEFPNKFQKL